MIFSWYTGKITLSDVPVSLQPYSAGQLSSHIYFLPTGLAFFFFFPPLPGNASVCYALKHKALTAF